MRALCFPASNRRRRRGVVADVQIPLFAPHAASIRRVHAIVNPASGGVGAGAADELASLFAEFGLDHAVSELRPRRTEAMVRAAIDAGPDLMVVLGGDGTARLVAELCGPEGPPVAPLSGGTMNKLGRALYGPRPWREALSDALSEGSVRWISGGAVAGHAFYCSAVLGSPAMLAHSREAIRAHQIGRAWRRAVVASRHAFNDRLGYDFDGCVGHGLAIGLICPTVSRAADGDETALEAAVLDPPDAKAGVRLALSNLFGDWREDPDVTVRRCVRGRAWSRDPIPVMLDGELFRMGRQVEARFRHRAFRALVPAHPVGERQPPGA